MRSLTLKNLGSAARWFHALADETRLQIIERLRDGEQCVCELTDLLQTGQSRLSFHLKTLKDAGIVTDRREGRWIYYSLNSHAIEELEEFIGSIKPKGRVLRVASNCCE
jgi:ArsR family transcriptional regulator